MGIKDKLRPIKAKLLSQTRMAMIARAAGALLPEVACVDVGASYYPHPAWKPFLLSPKTTWIAVEPNEQNLGYTRPWGFAANLKIVNTGLSQAGGKQTLYVTNVDSGSSLLPPVIPPGETYRYMHDYFFPVREVSIDTKTLDDVVKAHAGDRFLTVKLDTQGSELSILKGLNAKSLVEKLLCVEIEVSLRANPPMQGSARFYEVQQMLEGLGLELVQIKTIEGNIPTPNPALKGARTVLNECDCVYLIRQEEAKKRGRACQEILLGLYLCYHLYGEAKELAKGLDSPAAAALRDLL